jgi:hypothetical protein
VQVSERERERERDLRFSGRGLHCRERPVAGEESTMTSGNMSSMRGMKNVKAAPPSSEGEARAIRALSKRPGKLVPVPDATLKQTREVDPNQLKG